MNIKLKRLLISSSVILVILMNSECILAQVRPVNKRVQIKRLFERHHDYVVRFRRKSAYDMYPTDYLFNRTEIILPGKCFESNKRESDSSITLKIVDAPAPQKEDSVFDKIDYPAKYLLLTVAHSDTRDIKYKYQETDAFFHSKENNPNENIIALGQNNNEYHLLRYFRYYFPADYNKYEDYCYYPLKKGRLREESFQNRYLDYDNELENSHNSNKNSIFYLSTGMCAHNGMLQPISDFQNRLLADFILSKNDKNEYSLSFNLLIRNLDRESNKLNRMYDTYDEVYENYKGRYLHFPIAPYKGYRTFIDRDTLLQEMEPVWLSEKRWKYKKGTYARRTNRKIIKLSKTHGSNEFRLKSNIGLFGRNYSEGTFKFHKIDDIVYLISRFPSNRSEGWDATYCWHTLRATEPENIEKTLADTKLNDNAVNFYYPENLLEMPKNSTSGRMKFVFDTGSCNHMGTTIPPVTVETRNRKHFISFNNIKQDIISTPLRFLKAASLKLVGNSGNPNLSLKIVDAAGRQTFCSGRLLQKIIEVPGGYTFKRVE